MKFLMIVLTVLVLQSCACNSCEEAEMPKHEFSIGAIVHHRLDSNQKYIIQDTLRDGCEPAYGVEDKDGYYEEITEINLKK